MDFESIINELKGDHSEEDGWDPSHLYEDLGRAWSDQQKRQESADAKIKRMSENEKALQHQLEELKARNYDLLTKVDGNSEDDDNNGKGETQDDGLADLRRIFGSN